MNGILRTVSKPLGYFHLGCCLVLELRLSVHSTLFSPIPLADSTSQALYAFTTLFVIIGYEAHNPLYGTFAIDRSFSYFTGIPPQVTVLQKMTLTLSSPLLLGSILLLPNFRHPHPPLLTNLTLPHPHPSPPPPPIPARPLPNQHPHLPAPRNPHLLGHHPLHHMSLHPLQSIPKHLATRSQQRIRALRTLHHAHHTPALDPSPLVGGRLGGLFGRCLHHECHAGLVFV